MLISNDYYLIVDVEATCSNDGKVPRDEMEIVEIGSVHRAITTENDSFRIVGITESCDGFVQARDMSSKQAVLAERTDKLRLNERATGYPTRPLPARPADRRPRFRAVQSRRVRNRTSPLGRPRHPKTSSAKNPCRRAGGWNETLRHDSRIRVCLFKD